MIHHVDRSDELSHSVLDHIHDSGVRTPRSFASLSEPSLGMKQGMHGRAEYDQAPFRNVDGSIALIHEMLPVINKH